MNKKKKALVNRLQNTRTSRKGINIIFWRLLPATIFCLIPYNHPTMRHSIPRADCIEQNFWNTWFSFLNLTASILRCRDPDMTQPSSSYLVIWSDVRPISPRRGIRLPSATKAAMAEPSPGRRAVPISLKVSCTFWGRSGPTWSSSSSSSSLSGRLVDWNCEN